MKDYYGILGVARTASADEVKKAYRKAAMKHHPDRGGDPVKFKEISEAYEILSDNEKRALLDQGIDPLNPHTRQPNPNDFPFHHFQNVQDIFDGFGFNFNFGGRPQVKNKTINVNMTLTLEEAYNGLSKTITIRYPNGKDKNVTVNIPRGIDNGMAIRYNGMGDDSIAGIPPGDLTVVINVAPHPKFAREGLNLLTDVSIDCFEAMAGTSVNVDTLDGRTLQVTVPPGTQPNTTLGVKNEGMKDGGGNSGKLYIRVGVVIPTVIDPFKLQLIQQLKN